MNRQEKPLSLEEQATEILKADAKEHHTTLFREGILDERRQRLISKREIPLSSVNLTRK